MKHYSASIAAAKFKNNVLQVDTIPIISIGKIENIIGTAHKIVAQKFPRSDGWLTAIAVTCLEDPNESYMSDPDWGFEKAKEKINL